MKKLPVLSASCALLLTALFPAARAAEQPAWKFDFGGNAAAGFTKVTPEAAFSEESGYGFMPGAAVQVVNRGGAEAAHDGFVTSAQPFFFSASVPEGVYRITVGLGDKQEASTTTVKSEARRLQLEKVETAKGKFTTQSFLVAVKRPEFPGGKVALKAPEQAGHRDWDAPLTLEFSNTHPALCTLEIAPAQKYTTVYIAGDSTVTDQNNEPYAGWGQMLPRFFNDTVAVSNHAHSGLALSSFEHGKRLAKILSTMKAGDYLFIQFGHNDQKDKAPGAGPFTSYKANLKKFVEAVRAKGGLPVLVTPMERRRFDKAGQIGATLSEYAEAVRQEGQEDKVPVIDLNAMSLKFYAALGAENSKKALVYYAANTFPGQEKALSDDTHHSAYGAYELARCVVEGIREAKLDLVKALTPDAKPFDPAKPDAPETFSLPLTPSTRSEKPEGS